VSANGPPDPWLAVPIIAVANLIIIGAQTSLETALWVAVAFALVGTLSWAGLHYRPSF